MKSTTTNETLYFLRRGDQESGPYLLSQLRAMWQNGSATADASYRFDPSTEWQPLPNLRRLLDPRPHQTALSTPRSQGAHLTLPIIALVLAFIPIICIGGVICGHIALKQARADNDATARVISIIALVVTQNALARALGVPPRRVNEIIHGKRVITLDTSLRLGRFFGQSLRFWLNVQTECDLRNAKKLIERVTREVHPMATAAA